jgi:hypothetical protein
VIVLIAEAVIEKQVEELDRSANSNTTKPFASRTAGVGAGAAGVRTGPARVGRSRRLGSAWTRSRAASSATVVWRSWLGAPRLGRALD